jgi:carbonic anhydrase
LENIFLKNIRFILALSLGFVTCDMASAQSPAKAVTQTAADIALANLKSGNQRYLANKTLHYTVDREKREISAMDGQKPVAIVLGCSDSRVPVEMVFDQGLAEIFVVRVAGNVCADSELASIEYGVKYLNIPLIIVLGHSNCGAVKAAVDSAVGGAKFPGRLPVLMNKIAPAVAAAKRSHPSQKGDELVASVAQANVWLAANDILQGSEIVKQAVFSNKVKIVGAMRDLKSGKVAFLGEYPQPARLMGK